MILFHYSELDFPYFDPVAVLNITVADRKHFYGSKLEESYKLETSFIRVRIVKPSKEYITINMEDTVCPGVCGSNTSNFYLETFSKSLAIVWMLSFENC